MYSSINFNSLNAIMERVLKASLAQLKLQYLAHELEPSQQKQTRSRREPSVTCHRRRVLPPPLQPMGESRSDFTLSIMRIAVAQICQSVGYEAARTSALDTLSNIVTRYLKAVAKSAMDSANSHGRTHSNLIDIVVAFEDVGSVQGFAGASSSSSSSWSRIQASIINSSSLLKEIRKFVLYSDEIPFAQPLPRKNFTGHRGAHRKEKGSYNCEMNLGHVPRWLPEMPAIEGRNDVEIEESLRWGFGVQNMVVEGRRKEWGRGDGGGLDLPKKRRKVRFEMGLKGNTGGVLSRVGIGKRVLCHNLGSGTGASDTIEEGNERKKKTEKMKMVSWPF